MTKLAIITGTSRGLGFHLAHDFLKAGYTVIGIARNNSIQESNFHFLKLDLAKAKNISLRLDQYLRRKKISSKNEHVVLIHNAATVLPINYVHALKEDDVLQSYLLNLHSPIMLAHSVARNFLAKSRHLTVCNISSGAAIKPLMNWSIYCAMKSGLKMFTDCLNVDYSDSSQFKAFSFYPGVMDTQMQETIRKQKSKNFKNVDSFKKLKKTNNLLDPKIVSNAIFKIINNPKKIDKTEYNIQDL